MTDKDSNPAGENNQPTKLALEHAEKALSSALDRELRQTDEYKNSFAEFAHEIKTPLTAILGYLDIMRMEINGPLGHPSYLEYIDVVHDSSHHLMRLCDQFLSDRTESSELIKEEVDVSVMIDGVKKLFEPIAEKRGVELTADISLEFPKLHTDPVRLNQILINLVSNSIKYTPSGGNVDIQARYHETTGAMIFVVQDNGQGMSVEDTKNIFKPYTTAENMSPHGDDSTGLGLSIVNRLMNDIHGELALTTRTGEGTIVRLAFPISAVDPEGEYATIEQLIEQKKRIRGALKEDDMKFPFARKSKSRRKGGKP